MEAAWSPAAPNGSPTIGSMWTPAGHGKLCSSRRWLAWRGKMAPTPSPSGPWTGPTVKPAWSSDARPRYESPADQRQRPSKSSVLPQTHVLADLALPSLSAAAMKGAVPPFHVIYWCTASSLLHQINPQGFEPGAGRLSARVGEGRPTALPARLMGGRGGSLAGPITSGLAWAERRDWTAAAERRGSATCS